MSHWFDTRPLTSATLSILGLLSDSLTLSCVMEILSLVLQVRPFHKLQQFLDGIVVGVGQLEALNQNLSGS